MKMEKDVRGLWRVWLSEYATIGFNESTKEVAIRNFAGRFEGDNGNADALNNGLGERLQKFLYSNLNDQTVTEIMATVTDYLIGKKHEGSIREVIPTYQHDCADCIFLGRSRSFMDLYFCEQGSSPFPTIIARWGSEPSENKSGLLIAATGQDEELFEGLELAVRSGLFLGREQVLKRLGDSKAVEGLLQAV